MVYEKDSDGKPQQTKNEFVAEALKYAHNKRMEPKNVLMDSTYLLNTLDKNKKNAKLFTARLYKYI